MNIVITKTLLDISETMHALTKMRHQPLSFPLLNIHTLSDSKWPLICHEKRDYQALLFTSRYGILSFLRLIQDKPDLHYFYKIPTYVVGGKTASVAIEHGFETILHVGANAQDLACYLSQEKHHETGPLLYISGQETSFDFETFFLMAGYRFDRLIVYKSIGAQRMPMHILAKFLTAWVEGIMFYSSKGAEVFVQLAQKYQLNLKKVNAFCLSKQISEHLTTIPFKSKRVAAHPGEEALLQLLKP